MAKTELIQLRKYNTKFFDNNTAEIHCGHIHYKDGAGDYQPIDKSFEDMGVYWRMIKDSHKLYVAKDFGAAQLIRYDNKFENANHTIYFEPHSLQWVHKITRDRILIKMAQSVIGVLSTDKQEIVYSNAFGNNVDFIVSLRYGGFRKAIRFNVRPILSPPSPDYAPVFLNKFTANNLTLKASDLSDWDNDNYYESQEDFTFSEINSTIKTHIHRAYIWDSSATNYRTRKKLKLFFEKRNNVLWQAKVLPKTYFSTATYPIYADATYNSITAGDGYVGLFDNPGDADDWADVHDPTTGNFATDNTHGIISSSLEDGDVDSIIRAVVPFDTSSLPDNATVTAATLSLFFYSLDANGDNDGKDYATVVETNTVATNNLENADYGEIGESLGSGWTNAHQTDIIEAVDAAQHKDISSVILNGYTVFTFNAAGRGMVNLTGDTKLGVREGHDIEDVAVDQDTTNLIRFHTSESAGNEPILTVTYTTPGNAGIMTTNAGFWGATL